jgi:capsular polysaccharide transport system permease protein
MVFASLYLFAIAEDQYASSLSFSVRSENIEDTLGILGGLSSLSGTSSSDTDVLYQFIQSQELVKRVDARIDLRAIYSKPDFDPYYAFDKTGSIEDMVDYWRSMVKTFYDSGTGLIELRVHAFDPVDAQKIAQEIYNQSSAMINHLSAIGRDDATRCAKDDMNRAM